MELFSERLKSLRKEKKLSQKEVALDLDISQALLSHYERGIRECGLEFLLKAANYYGVSVDFMLGRTSSKTGSLCVANNDEKFNEVLNALQIILDRICENEDDSVGYAAKKLFEIEISKLLNMLSAFSETRNEIFESDYGITSSLLNCAESRCKSELLFALRDSGSEPPDFSLKHISKKYPTICGSLKSIAERSEKEAMEYIFGEAEKV
ncbi:MAG: helix-turn-helix domain-containing protein [Acutalibacteraceae bacterium]